jgi:hypothetical protein
MNTLGRWPLVLALTAQLGCFYGMKVASPSRDLVHDDDEVVFRWDNENDLIGWPRYVLQLSIEPEFDGDVASFAVERSRVAIDIKNHLRIVGRTRVYWRVRGERDPFFRTCWSKTQQFDYRPGQREARRPVVLERAPAPPAPPPEVIAPVSLAYGKSYRVDDARTFSLGGDLDEVARRFFMWKLWDQRKLRFMERENLAGQGAEDPALLPPTQLYAFETDGLNEILSLESLTKWTSPEVYLLANFYSRDERHSLFCRLVDVKSGVVIWQHFENVQARLESADAFAQLWQATRAPLQAVLGERPVVVAGVYANDAPDDALRLLAEQLLLRGGTTTLLLRDPPVKRTLRVVEKQADGSALVRERTLYKLYERQFSNIMRDGRQVWPEADEHIALELLKLDAAPPAELLIDKGVSDEQLEKFWQSPRLAVRATFVDTRTGTIRGVLTVVARDHVSSAALAAWLAERVGK